MWQRLGDRAIRFARPRAANTGEPVGLLVSARAIVREVRGWHGVVDVVVAAEDVAAYFADSLTLDATQLHFDRHIAKLASATDSDEAVREHVLRVRYDGADLDEVARATGLSRDEVIVIHSGATYTVETIGFAPGFGYLSGLDPRLELPRRATPRSRVPAGSVAIAGRQSAVYPFDSPGGWHLLGRLVGTNGGEPVKMFDERGALLALGDRVRFVREAP
ncbi:MAG TPA: carboxyltransferase domain-containing protein [Kofleriaceae bacterium]|nr:carboxyltransferase domain-containing protein [Kofleriaceae bacterium]